jgi:hypothetical protein
LFHQKEPRVKAHVLVAFLGYALWVTLKHLLQRRLAIVPQPSAGEVDQAQPLSSMKALALLSTLWRREWDSNLLENVVSTT